MTTQELEWLPAEHAHMKTLDWRPTVADWLVDGHLDGYKVESIADHEGNPTFIEVSRLELCDGQFLFFDSRPVGDTGENIVEPVKYIFQGGKLVEA